MSWQAISSSVPGTSHSDSGICQDTNAFQILEGGEIVIGAISDGMGSAKYSQVGSKLAVQITISELQKVKWSLQPIDDVSVTELFSDVLARVTHEISEESNITGCQLKDLACTLITFVASPTWLIALQIGDGILVGRSQNSAYELLIKPDKGEYINETTSITDIDGLQASNIFVKLATFDFICAASDGIENICLQKNNNWSPFHNFFAPLETHLKSDGNSSYKQAELESFLNSERINAVTDDDKTLLLCSYQKEREITSEKQLIQAGINKQNTNAVKHNSENNIHSSMGTQLPSLSAAPIPQNISLQRKKRKGRKLRRSGKPSDALKKLEEQILSEVILLGNPQQMFEVEFKQKKRAKQEILEIWLFSERPLRSRRKLAAIIQKHLDSIEPLTPLRTRVFNLSPSAQGEVEYLRSFEIINRRTFAFHLFVLTTIYGLGIIVFFDFISITIPPKSLAIVLLYSVITIPFLLYYFYLQCRDW